ncbi:ribosomal RNA small subunit methyltransferase H domain protein [Mycobacterium avium MAV_061107_1842]|nr:ribosomal RNA small subunit methyltransferase H domain protein [Mycobacterium avium MAV_061107_1842]
MVDDSPDFGHVPVLLERCVELLTPALTRRHPDGSARSCWTPPWARAGTPNGS